MNDSELRALVREIVRRQLQVQSGLAAPAADAGVRAHPSHQQFAVLAGADTGGPCLVEPAVGCVHCGYCRSWGY